MIQIRPRVGMYGAFARLNYKPWYALSEFIDNALQSYLSNREALRASGDRRGCLEVRIDVDGDRLVITDTAAGIASDDIARAFIPAERPPDTAGLSEFGIGMKAAASWFASRWMVRTSALGEPIERTVRFDVPAIIKNNIEEIDVEEVATSASAHYTTIVLEDLNQRMVGSTVSKVKTYLGGIYRHFIRAGQLRLLYRGEPVEYVQPEVLLAARQGDDEANVVEWYRTFDLQLDEQHRVHGWAALRSKASTTDAGFAVFRRQRLVMGGYDSPYRPEEIFKKPNSFTYQRLFGEINVEGFQVSHTKDGLHWDQWEPDILAWLKTELDTEPLPLLWQAEAFRARATRTTVTHGWGESAVMSATAAIAAHAPTVVDEQLDAEPTAEQPLSALPVAEQVTAANSLILELDHNQRRWKIRLELARDPAMEDWYSYSRSDDASQRGVQEIQIRLNLSHPFSEQFILGREDELDPMLRLSAGLAIAEITAVEAGVRAAPTIRRNFNQLLRQALWHPR